MKNTCANCYNQKGCVIIMQPIFDKIAKELSEIGIEHFIFEVDKCKNWIEKRD